MVDVIIYTGTIFSIATKIVLITTIIMGTVVTDMVMRTVQTTAAITTIIGSTTTRIITPINSTTAIVEIRLRPAVAITIIFQVANIVVECLKGNHINK